MLHTLSAVACYMATVETRGQMHSKLISPLEELQRELDPANSNGNVNNKPFGPFHLVTLRHFRLRSW
jgi:hypothetical protein